MRNINFKGLIAGAALALCALAPFAAEASPADRFKSVKAWSVTFEIRYDLDKNGNPHKMFEGTRSVAGSLRWGEPSEDYGITWSGIGKATVTTTEGTEEIEIEESFLSIVPEDNMYSAMFGDADARVTIGSSSSMIMLRLGELLTPEMPLPQEGMVLSHDGTVDNDEGLVIHMKYSIAPAQ